MNRNFCVLLYRILYRVHVESHKCTKSAGKMYISVVNYAITFTISHPYLQSKLTHLYESTGDSSFVIYVKSTEKQVKHCKLFYCSFCMLYNVLSKCAICTRMSFFFPCFFRIIINSRATAESQCREQE